MKMEWAAWNHAGRALSVALATAVMLMRTLNIPVTMSTNNRKDSSMTSHSGMDLRHRIFTMATAAVLMTNLPTAWAVSNDDTIDGYEGMTPTRVDPWLLGACINICGSICINLGTNLVKLSHNKAQSMGNSESHSQFASFTIGMAVFVLGNILNFISMVCIYLSVCISLSLCLHL